MKFVRHKERKKQQKLSKVLESDFDCFLELFFKNLQKLLK